MHEDSDGHKSKEPESNSSLKSLLKLSVFNENGHLLYFTPWGGCQLVALCYILNHWSEYVRAFDSNTSHNMYMLFIFASFISLPIMSGLGYLLCRSRKLREKFFEPEYIDQPSKAA